MKTEVTESYKYTMTVTTNDRGRVQSVVMNAMNMKSNIYPIKYMHHMCLIHTCISIKLYHIRLSQGGTHVPGFPGGRTRMWPYIYNEDMFIQDIHVHIQVHVLYSVYIQYIYSMPSDLAHSLTMQEVFAHSPQVLSGEAVEQTSWRICRKHTSIDRDVSLEHPSEHFLLNKSGS